MKTAIVTGASSGIGKAIATRLAEEKMNVVLAARSENKLQQIAEDLTETTEANILPIQTDISNQTDVSAMVEQAKERFGTIDVYVNNAGAMLSGAVTEGALEDWEQMIDVNIKGVLYGLHQVIPEMVERGEGHIVNIASVSGFEVSKQSTVYSATKFAVRAISTGLEKELARTGVRITNISPGMVDTSLNTRGNADRKPLDASNIADSVAHAILQPAHVNINEMTIRPV